MRWLPASVLSPVLSGLLVVFAVSLPPKDAPLMWNAKEDITGDNKPEIIRLVNLGNGKFRLHINQATVEGRLLEDTEGFYITDVNRADKYREVVVYSPGPSDDYEHVLFWFDGQRIRKMGHLMRVPKYLGNGIVLVDDWMGFWVITRKYVLTKNRTLIEVPQEFYYVGVTGKVGKPLTLYQTRQGKKPLATLRVGSKAEILLSDSKDWYLVRSENRLLGWAREDAIMKAMWSSLPLAD